MKTLTTGICFTVMLALTLLSHEAHADCMTDSKNELFQSICWEIEEQEFQKQFEQQEIWFDDFHERIKIKAENFLESQPYIGKYSAGLFVASAQIARGRFKTKIFDTEIWGSELTIDFSYRRNKRVSFTDPLYYGQDNPLISHLNVRDQNFFRLELEYKF